jgi:pseudo-rSAM protein
LIQDYIENIKQIKEKKWRKNLKFNILINSGINQIKILEEANFHGSIIILVYSENDYLQFSNMSELEFEDIIFIPIYNNNISFFESEVFIDKDDIDTMQLNKKEIFIRQTLNTFDFGRLNIMPNGFVYANVNNPSLGKIDDSPYSIVYKEFTEGKSWFNIRDKKPCTDCLYQWLCPSPSNYEIAIGKSNLCHLIK